MTKARAELSDLVNRVAYGGERVVLSRHGRAVAAIVPAADLERLLAADAADAAAGPGRGSHGLVVLGSDASAGRASDPGSAPALAPAAEWGPPGPGAP